MLRPILAEFRFHEQLKRAKILGIRLEQAIAQPREKATGSEIEKRLVMHYGEIAIPVQGARMQQVLQCSKVHGLEITSASLDLQSRTDAELP